MRSDADLAEFLGAVFGWSWCRWCREWLWVKLYWPARQRPRVRRPSPPPPRRRMYWSGCVAHSRGRHFDRRRRS